MTLKVGVLGARGKVGSEVSARVAGTDDLELVAAIDLGDDLGPATGPGSEAIIDFTHSDAVVDNLVLIDHGIHAVVGTTASTTSGSTTGRGLAGRRPGQSGC